MNDTYFSILNAARGLFSKQGFTATPVRQIAQKAGIGKATIYHHFKDKESIILALIKENIRRIKEILLKVKSESDPVKCIEASVNGVIGFLFETSDIFQTIRREVPGVRQKMQEEIKSVINDNISILSEAISNGTKRGIFRQIDPARTARVLMTMIQGTIASVFLASEIKPPIEKLIPVLLDIFYKGINSRHDA